MSRAKSAGWRLALVAVAVLLPACQQRMAKQPYYRPLDNSPFFDDGRASRPIEPGTVSRDQLLDSDPMLSGLTPEVRKAVAHGQAAAGAPGAPPAVAAAAPAPGMQATLPQAGAPSDVKNYVDTFPFQITEADLERGATRYAVFCTPCHGPLGNGGGKIVERGYLRPPSFHRKKVEATEFTKYPGDEGYSGEPNALPRGFSRGFDRWGKRVSLTREAGPDGVAPEGYFFEVITHGYGGMPAYRQQIPPDDRWRIIAFIRALQLSQDVPADKQEALKKIREAEGEKKPAAGEGGHK
jgi:mono/diheme cytochrome c family protein